LAFFNSIGYYVYGYKENGIWVYFGKGKDFRCLDHIKEKGYLPENCFIISKNIEKFGGDGEMGALILESYLINKYDPRDNKVSGHYKECFDMAKMSNMAKVFLKSQRNMMDEGNDLRVLLESKYGNVQKAIQNSTSYFVISGGISGLYMTISSNNKDDNVTVNIAEGAGKTLPEGLVDAIKKDLGDEVPVNESKDHVVSWIAKDLDDAVESWDWFQKRRGV